MDTSVQLGENFPIVAYLSYRCKIDRDIQARDRLKNLCIKQGISLRYDEVETDEGDSLIEFMEDLTSARCVFLFLSPEYFQSAYTLFELIRINEWADLDRRFILPIRLSESMVTNQSTASKTHFDNNPAIRNELARLLKLENADHGKLWQRIDAAWQKHIYHYLDKLNVSLESDKSGTALANLLIQTQAAVTDAIRQSTEQLHDTIKNKISAILARNYTSRGHRCGFSKHLKFWV